MSEFRVLDKSAESKSSASKLRSGRSESPDSTLQIRAPNFPPFSKLSSLRAILFNPRTGRSEFLRLLEQVRKEMGTNSPSANVLFPSQVSIRTSARAPANMVIPSTRIVPNRHVGDDATRRSQERQLSHGLPDREETHCD
ncbi:hypothetical protein CEXT_327031 [Caerostris extrusa]|uniref:Uncharacterized protein n=1 Tax=Caerostris extrusa TaxID=172846 RepID=A0AAV4SZS0_CAEEX|nr:hypothetical protein CEXT_327031 [Caerostris extrusa]